MSTRGLLVLALDFLGAERAGRFESRAGDVGESFRLAAVRVGDEVDGEVMFVDAEALRAGRGGVLAGVEIGEV